MNKAANIGFKSAKLNPSIESPIAMRIKPKIGKFIVPYKVKIILPAFARGFGGQPTNRSVNLLFKPSLVTGLPTIAA